MADRWPLVDQVVDLTERIAWYKKRCLVLEAAVGEMVGNDKTLKQKAQEVELAQMKKVFGEGC